MKEKNKPIELSNQIIITPQDVLKRYQGPGVIQRWKTEQQLLQTLAGELPLPKLLDHPVDAEILMEKTSAVAAVELIHENNSAVILAEIGSLLAHLQSLPVRDLHHFLKGNGGILVHGDFSLETIHLDSLTYHPLAIMDWEWAHLGDAVEDVAWMEWFIRMQMGKFTRDLPTFYEAYGSTPPWNSRKDAMIEQCLRRLEYARMVGRRKSIQHWQSMLQITTRLQAL